MRYCCNKHDRDVALVYVAGHEGFHYCPICEPDEIPDELMPVLTARGAIESFGNSPRSQAKLAAAVDTVLVDPDDEELTSTFGKISFTDACEIHDCMPNLTDAERLDSYFEEQPDGTVIDVTEDAMEANPKKAYGDNKVALHLVPPVIDIYASLAAWEGMVKYGVYNYREIPVEIMTYIGAIRRHLDAILDGEDMDPGYWQEVRGEMMWFPPKPHLAGIIMSAGIIADCFENGNLIDNRPKEGSASELLKKYQKDSRPGPTSPKPGGSVRVQGEEVGSDSDVGRWGGWNKGGFLPDQLG